jgi:hypothetical protein
MSRPKTPADVGSLARSYTTRSIEILGGLQETSPEDSVKVAAARVLLDRGWGKPKETTEFTGANGGPLEFIVRTIMEGSKPPKK